MPDAVLPSPGPHRADGYSAGGSNRLARNLPDVPQANVPQEANQETDALQTETVSEANPDMVAATATRYLDELGSSNTENTDEPADDLPCEYLGATGCTFPHDLRPFGCTTYICKYMYARLDRSTLTRIKRLNRELEDKHAILLRTIQKQRMKDEG